MGEQQEVVSTLQTTGRAAIAVDPDRAVIDIGVVTQSPDASAAAADNAAQLHAALTALSEVLGERADIRTLGFNLKRNQPYLDELSEHPKEPTYEATNTVRVTVDDLSMIGPVIDAATRSGANQVNGLEFTLRDPLKPRLQALREAATRARTEADTLALALGVKILRVLRIGGSDDRWSCEPSLSVDPSDARSFRAQPTPIKIGTINVTAGVTLTAEVGPLEA